MVDDFGLRHVVGSRQSADNTVHDLIAIANDLRRHIDAELAALGYTDRRPTFAPLLSRVWQRQIPQGQLAEAMGVSAQAASQTVGLAEQAGYVARRPNPDDGRSKVVGLTDLGRAFVADGAAAITERAAAYAAILGIRRFTRFDSALARLRIGLAVTDEAEPVASLAPRTSIISVSVLAGHAMGRLRDAMAAGGHDQITAGQNLVLVYVGPDGARSSELARAQRVSRQAVSAVLNDLEDKGYLERRDDAADGRGVVFVPSRRGRRVLDDYVAAIDVIEASYAEILGSTVFDELARSARDLSRMLTLEHTFSGAVSAVPDAPNPRRQGELAELAGELHRWLGASDTWWLSGILRQQVIDDIDAARTERAEAFEGGSR